MTVAKAAAVDRRLSAADLRTQLERTRRSRFSDELKVSMALLVVIAVFVVSWAPISLVNAVETFQLAAVPSPLERAAICMMFLQSAVNPTYPPMCRFSAIAVRCSKDPLNNPTNVRPTNRISKPNPNPINPKPNPTNLNRISNPNLRNSGPSE